MKKFLSLNCLYKRSMRMLKSWKTFCLRSSYAGIIPIALCVCSCKTIREWQLVGESMQVSERLQVMPLPVPAMVMELKASLGDITSLPPGATYVHRANRGSVSVSYERDTVYITAHCDSINAMIAMYEKDVKSLKDIKTEKETKPTTAGFSLKWFLHGSLAGFLIGIIGIILKNRIL